MIGYAAAGYTWGIPGPAFLLVFLGVAAILVVGARARRARLLRGPANVQLGQVGPQQVAYLNGGDRLAAYAALSGLRGAGAVGVNPDRTLAVSGPVPAGATPLDVAVHQAAGRRLYARSLTLDSWVGGALDQLRGDLERAGLAVCADDRHAARRTALPLLALGAVGLARIVAGVAGDRPVGFLVLAEIGVLVAAAVLYARVPRRTTAGRQAMEELRRRNSHLSPKHRPAMAAYGATGAAMGVALFGVGALWAMDPAFAAGAEIERVAAGPGSGYTGDGGSGGDGGGGGCGGGGCGGGCGG
jgi:uncharacterized protein (TIGR04222 family)